eukprot:CAMPEP_0206244614 /NCGR_PEP_ID=MMETSP0047_2-20121206/18255_1 /ASSEMBLY_ACC=CAM_ASM_000192 /TAXON_ID=195065 /ORGANISM="Chroomonas mesostigmatica_cf, Strain CCMP1168" /LENGTH=164 /DNA_ID=CAMNT_0053669853 /DNA_START=24 /DNA_END=518 /DNA_ORIENTATION=-
MSKLLAALAVACLVAEASAFCTSPAQCVASSFTARAVSTQPRHSLPLAKSSRAPAVAALRMQTEDEKAKASGIACAVAGLIFSKFSILIAVLVGGGAVYCAKLPEEGDKGLGDTAKQVSLLIGTYAMKLFDFVRQKDAEEGWTKKVTAQAKEAIESAKGSIKQG